MVGGGLVRGRGGREIGKGWGERIGKGVRVRVGGD